MRDPTQSFVIREFSKYYRSQDIELPERLHRREFGFMFFDRQFVMRHIGFKNRKELKSYILENAPAHIYYSSAYYENPNASTMVDKMWMGADLIFDLDADHVKEAKEKSYAEMLEIVKHETKRLIDQFILDDLGFDLDSLKIVFSGGRGYHIHIKDPRVFSMKSQERREIVDYITGTDLDFNWVFPTRLFDAVQYGPRVQTKSKIEMPGRGSGGWRRRLAEGIGRFIVDLEAAGEEEVVRRYSELRGSSGRAIGGKTIRGMYRELFNDGGGVRGVDRIRTENNLEIFSKQNYLTAFMRLVEEHARIELVGETDEPVTSDIKRLIRLPGSLHGKTGLKVVSLKRKELDDFDPLRDAVPDTLGEDTVEMQIIQPVDVELRGQRFNLEPGEAAIPKFAALFLACRKLAEVS